MTRFRLLAVLVVLLQSLLTAAQAHTHANFAHQSAVPHLHAGELLELFTTAHDSDQHEGDNHDADAVELADVVNAPTPPTLQTVALDLSASEIECVLEVASGSSPFPVSWPPSTAGPHTPLYLTFCTFRN